MTAAACPTCGHELPEIDVRRVPVRWAELEHLVSPAATGSRGFTAEQVEYLRSCIGLTWAKAMSRATANAQSGK